MSVLVTESPLSAPQPAPPLGLRLLPAPPCEPPYDDERPGGRPLPLRPASLRGRRPLRLVEAVAEDRTTERADLRPVQPFARALVQRLLEVLAGVRPLAQLQRDTTLEVYDQLERALAHRRRPQGCRPDRRAVRSVHVQEQGSCAEVSATVRRQDRFGAVAFRLKRDGGQWRCTQLSLL